MAIELRCECGAELRLPNEAAGRRARCKHCGAVFAIPENVITTEVDEALRAEREAEVEREERLVALGGRLTPKLADEEMVTRGFWADALISFVMVRDLHNVLTFGLMWLLHALANIMMFVFVVVGLGAIAMPGLLGLFFFSYVFVAGYMCSLWLRVISETADGEDRWPGVSLSSIWEDVVLPFLQFAGSWLAVLWPGVTLGVVGIAIGKAAMIWPLVVVLFAGGVFLWPTVVLATSLGGIRATVRLDMHLATVFQAFPAYMAVWLMLSLAIGLAVVRSGLVDSLLGLSSERGIFSGWFIGAGVEAYCMLVVMRQVGLFFRHFQDKIPWALTEEKRRKQVI
jgi:hypothetical protein